MLQGNNFLTVTNLNLLVKTSSPCNKNFKKSMLKKICSRENFFFRYKDPHAIDENFLYLNTKTILAFMLPTWGFHHDKFLLSPCKYWFSLWASSILCYKKNPVHGEVGHVSHHECISTPRQKQMFLVATFFFHLSQERVNKNK